MKNQSLLLLLSCLCLHSASSEDDWEQTGTDKVFDFTYNPILEPTELFEWLLADPTVVIIGEKIHLFANEVFHGILHFTADSDFPTNFTKKDTIIPFPGAVRPYVHLEEDTIYLFYEQYQLPLFRTSHLMLRRANLSMDSSGQIVFDWETTSSTILVPELTWEKIGTQRVGNPFVFFSSAHSEYRMYYSASSSHLEDSNIDEPIYLGMARATSLTGPWERVASDPIPINTNSMSGKEVIGIGSIKFPKTETFNSKKHVALCNLVTRDMSNNSTGSTISLLTSTTDGLSWDILIPDLLPPQIDNPGSWKHAYVYGHDSIMDPTDVKYLLVFYNGRDGWRQAKEAIGVSRVDISLLA